MGTTLPEPKFWAGAAVTAWVGWMPQWRATVTKANKRGIWLSTGHVCASNGDVNGLKGHRLAATDRHREAAYRLSGITGGSVWDAAPHWARFTVEQLEAALEALGLGFEPRASLGDGKVEG